MVRRRYAPSRTMRPGNWLFDISMRSSIHRHLAADFSPQLVDQLETLFGLDMPEGPAVAGFRALRDRAHAVDRADLVAEHDGAVGAHQRAMTLLGVDQFCARHDHAALDQLGECDPRRIA